MLMTVKGVIICFNENERNEDCNGRDKQKALILNGVGSCGWQNDFPWVTLRLFFFTFSTPTVSIIFIIIKQALKWYFPMYLSRFELWW